MNKKKIISIIAIIIISCIFVKDVYSIGVISDPIVIKNVIRGQKIREELVMRNSEPKEVEFELSASGDIADWVSFYKDSEKLKEQIEKINVPSRSRAKVGVIINIPDGVKNGKYKGELNIRYNPNKKENIKESVASVIQQVSREVFITVTGKEIVDVNASVTPEKYVLEKGESLKIKAVYYNKGNVSVKPNLSVKISDKDKKTLLNAIFPYPENQEPVEPLLSKEIPIEWQKSDIDYGKYNARVEVSLDGNVIHKDNFSFVVEPVKTSNGVDNSFVEDNVRRGSFAEKFLNGGNIKIVFIVVVLFLFTISAILFLFLLKSKSKKKKKK